MRRKTTERLSRKVDTYNTSIPTFFSLKTLLNLKGIFCIELATRPNRGGCRHLLGNTNSSDQNQNNTARKFSKL